MDMKTKPSNSADYKPKRVANGFCVTRGCPQISSVMHGVI